MRQTLSELYAKYLSENFERLSAIRDQADSIDAAGQCSGDQAILLAITGCANVDQIVERAVMVANTKRTALILVGELLYFVNRYGVMTCRVPIKIAFAKFTVEQGPLITYEIRDKIFKKFGVTWNYPVFSRPYDELVNFSDVKKDSASFEEASAAHAGPDIVTQLG